MPKPKSNLSLVIVTCYISEILELALDSIEKNSYYDNEIIIIADFPSWQTLKVIQERKLTHYTTYFNHYMICCNFGAWKAHREYVALINDDVYFGYHWDKALMNIVQPYVLGSVYRYEIQNYNSCGYDGVDWRTFKPKLLEEAIARNKWNKPDPHYGFPGCHHREVFFEYYGYSFHAGAGKGGEPIMAYRMKKDLPEAKILRSYESGIFHFGHPNNLDKKPFPIKTEHLGFKNGLRLCLGCGKAEVLDPISAGEWGRTEECSECYERGYWLCLECKTAGKKDTGEYLLWNFWPREPEKYDQN